MPTKRQTTVEYVVVNKDDIPEGTYGRGQLGPASEALLRGEAIWMPGQKNRSARFSRMANPRGFRVRTRTGDRDGVRGTYIWLEPLPTDVPAA